MTNTADTNSSRRRLAVIAAVLLVAAAAAVGGILIFQKDDAAQPQSDTQESSALSTAHVHSLAVDPADGTLYAATHEGLFKMTGGGSGTSRVGDDRSDLMGFSIVGRDRFISAGHPASPDGVNPLGLRESSDAGNSWSDVSLVGEVDFHILKGRGSWIYGFDGERGLVLVSKDGGVNWKEETAPSGLIDLAIDPSAPERVVAATDAGMMISSNAGNSWDELGPEVSMLLAWDKPRTLTRIDETGAVELSVDRGRSWRSTGSVPEQPVAFTRNGRQLFMATAENRILVSNDGGSSWGKY